MGTALFDLDRTLLDCNSGRLWVHHEWSHGRLGARDVIWAGYWLLRYGLGRSDGLETAMEAAAQSVRGLEEAVLDDRIRAWFAHSVRHRLRIGARKALDEHRARGDHLVLATSSTTYIGRAAAEAYGLDEVIATCLDVSDGRLTGKIKTLCVGQGKADAASAWAQHSGRSLEEATFYTDSASDLSLLERVGHPRVICPDRALSRIAAQRGWEIADWGGIAPGTQRGER